MILSKIVKKIKYILPILCIVFASVLPAFAQTVSTDDFTLTSNDSFQMALDNGSDVYTNEDGRTIRRGIYKGYVTLNLRSNTSGYLTGRWTISGQASFTAPSSFTVSYPRVDSNNIISDNIFTYSSPYGSNNGSFRVFGSASNYYLPTGDRVVPCAGFWVSAEVSVVASEILPAYITCTVSLSDIASRITLSDVPSKTGLAGEIALALQSIDQTDLASWAHASADWLEAIYLQNPTLANQVIGQIASDSAQLRALLSAFQSQAHLDSTAIYDLLYYYIYTMNATDTEAQSEAANAEAAMVSVANALDVTKPAPEAVVNGPEMLLNGEVMQAQGNLFSWLSSAWILPILLLAMLLAVISYVLYGKSG